MNGVCHEAGGKGIRGFKPRETPKTPDNFIEKIDGQKDDVEFGFKKRKRESGSVVQRFFCARPTLFGLTDFKICLCKASPVLRTHCDDRAVRSLQIGGRVRYLTVLLYLMLRDISFIRIILSVCSYMSGQRRSGGGGVQPQL